MFCSLHSHPFNWQLTGLEQDIILDSRAIRSTEWTDLLAGDPRKFALDDTAQSSEPPKPVALRSRHDKGIIYVNYDALCHSLRDRFKYLSLKEKSRLTGKRDICEVKPSPSQDPEEWL
jgi:hypothetical protein